MQLKPGLKLKSAVCATEVIVVRAPADPVEVACGGAPLLADGDSAAPGAALDPEHADGTLMGKRYADDELGIELLCTRPGEGSLSANGEVLHPKGAKPLPSSD
jgi:hypothetical protein